MVQFIIFAGLFARILGERIHRARTKLGLPPARVAIKVKLSDGACTFLGSQSFSRRFCSNIRGINHPCKQYSRSAASYHLLRQYEVKGLFRKMIIRENERKHFLVPIIALLSHCNTAYVNHVNAQSGSKVKIG